METRILSRARKNTRLVLQLLTVAKCKWDQERFYMLIVILRYMKNYDDVFLRLAFSNQIRQKEI